MKRFKTATAIAAAVLTSMVFGGAALASQAEREVVKVEAPEYPRGAQRRALEGHVTVRYTVTESGEIARGVFDRAVLRALDSLQYAPADTVTAGVERKFNFALES